MDKIPTYAVTLSLIREMSHLTLKRLSRNGTSDRRNERAPAINEKFKDEVTQQELTFVSSSRTTQIYIGRDPKTINNLLQQTIVSENLSYAQLKCVGQREFALQYP